MQVPILVLLFAGIPESIALTTLAFVLAKVDLEWKKICLIGFILAICAYFLRLLPITFGVHTIVSIGLLIILINAFTEADLVVSIVASFIGFLCLIFLETFVYFVVLHIFNLSMEHIEKNETLRVLFSVPTIILIFLISYIINAYKKRKM